MFQEILAQAGIILGYTLCGLVLILLGFWMIDLLTPGKLNDLIWVERSKNAAVLVCSNLLGIAMITVTSIFASADDFVRGLITTMIYGIIGLLCMAGCFLLIDALTPGKHGDLVHREDFEPAAFVNAAAHLAVAAVVSAAIW